MDAETARRLNAAATARGLTVKMLGPHKNHIQIVGGPLLVNFYPDAKKRSAYVAGTTQRKNNVSPEEAVEMAFTAPVLGPSQRKDSRLFSNRRKRPIRRSLRERDGDNCYWCHQPMQFPRGDHNSPMDATIEHRIPLDRGGLDNMNNMVLAHKKCNNERGNNMPELEGKDAV